MVDHAEQQPEDGAAGGAEGEQSAELAIFKLVSS
jgi:hypothetical protein